MKIEIYWIVRTKKSYFDDNVDVCTPVAGPFCDYDSARDAKNEYFDSHIVRDMDVEIKTQLIELQ